ncbi:hypothetical protein F5887DRAFT_984424, partial [Amanita rubescens]
MVKLTVSVSLVLLQLSVLSRTSVGVPLPPIGHPGWPIDPQPGFPAAPVYEDPVEGMKNAALVCSPVAAYAAVRLGHKLASHCWNKFRNKNTEADAESGPDPGSTAHAHNPHANHHGETPDENTPLIRPSADTAHPPDLRDTNHHGIPLKMDLADLLSINGIYRLASYQQSGSQCTHP